MKTPNQDHLDTSKKREQWLDKRLGLRVGHIQVIRLQFDRFDAKIPDIARRYKLNPLLVKSIKEYRVWLDIMPLGWKP